MNYNLFPSMRAIKLYEDFTGTSFLDLENNQDYVLHLIYCCLIAHPENNFTLTFNAACSNFFKKEADNLIAAFSSEMEFLNQFQHQEEEKEDNESTVQEDTSSPGKDKTLPLSSVIPILVYDCHLDIDYVLDRMPYTDIEMYVNYSISKKREAMEEQRFWTYLQMAPHIDSKKIKGPEDLIEFTWEKNKKKNEIKKAMDDNYQKLIDYGIIKPKENVTEEEIQLYNI